jgi:hypothetical protein
MKKLFITSIIGTLFLISCGGNNSSDNQEKWYEGGTLHEANISNWKTSSSRDKLATCGDFMATIDNTVSMDILKIRAKDLRTCINEATDDLESTNSESVSSIASLCLITLGY